MFKLVNKTLLSHYGKSPGSSRQIPLTLQTVTVGRVQKAAKGTMLLLALYRQGTQIH